MIPRDALDRLHIALEEHLAAVAGRSGENDPRVQSAYLGLRSAATDYDDAIYLTHDEVTPFDLPPLSEDDDEDVDEVALGDRFTVLTRMDFTVLDEARLRAGAGQVMGDEVDSAEVALTGLVHIGARRGLADPAAAGSFGLAWQGAVTAVLPAVETEADGAWVEDAFSDIDPDQVLCAFADVPSEDD